jgi:hypothetical protein
MTTTDLNAIKNLQRKAEALEQDLQTTLQAWEQKLDTQADIDATCDYFQQLEDEYYNIEWALDAIENVCRYLSELTNN